MRTTFYRHETNQGLVLSSNKFDVNPKQKVDGVVGMPKVIINTSNMLIFLTKWETNHFSSMNRGREYDDDDEDDTDSEDYYSPTDWERETNESDEDYSERMQDLEDWMESFD